MPGEGGSPRPASATARGGVSSVEPGAFASARRREAFLARLARMSREERVRAARHGGFDRWQRSLWAARFPEEVPLFNGEYEWIALGLADLD